MKIITENHDDRYSVEQIFCLFFEKDAEVEIISEYNGVNKIITTTFYNGVSESGEWEIHSDDLREFKNSVKKSAFISMQKISKNKVPWGILTGIRPTKFLRDLHKSRSYDDIEKILKDEYWVTEEKTKFCIEVSKNSERILAKMAKNDIGIYIGVPFCPSRCSYCSFISESSALYSRYMPEYTEALIKEIKVIAEFIKEFNFNIASLYIGGGTPPSLGTGLLSKVITEAIENFDISRNDVEFTVEAGRPDVIDDNLLEMLKLNGVNRLCINPQTMNDKTLKIIGRKHTAEQTYKAFELARKHSFENINSDVIAGLPGENVKDFISTLEQIGTLAPEELTVHTMYLKKTSEITKNKAWNNCGRDADEMVDFANGYLKRNNYIPYYMYKQRSTAGNLENTGYSKPGYESLYNVAIMEEARTVLACGAGASSKIISDSKVERVYNIKDAFSYIRDIDEITEHKKRKIRDLLIES